MGIFEKEMKMSTAKVVFIILCAILLVAAVTYFTIDDPSNIWGAIFGSLAAGMVVAVIQYVIAWQDYNQTDKLKKLKLIEILYTRSVRDKYANYIRGCNRKLDVMGVTGVRFFNDFADTSTQAPDDATVLLNALNRNVRVRILLPSDDNLPPSKKVDSARVREKYKELRNYQNLEIRYFNHIATHSIFRIDDTCIIGPVFPELESRNTPALHVMNSSPMAVNYLNYFESEWNVASKA